MPRHNDDQHAQRHDDDIAVLQKQVRHVHRFQQGAVRHDLEERHDRDQREQQPVFPKVPHQIGADPRRL